LFKEAVNHESLKRLVDNKGKGAHSAIIKIEFALLRLLSAALASGLRQLPWWQMQATT
jgi:hypothetical protein